MGQEERRKRRRPRSQYDDVQPSTSEASHERWDEVELQLIRDLPSRAKGARPSIGDVLHSADPERNWTSDLRRRRTRRRTYASTTDRLNTLRGDAIHTRLEDHDLGDGDDTFLGQLEDETTRAEALRELQAPLAAKRSLKARLDTLDRGKHPDFINKSKAQVIAGGRQMYKVMQFYALGLWRSHLRTIASHFGSGVTSYFLFLRSLLLHNCVILALALCFQVIPQLLYRFLQGNPPGYVTDGFSPEQLITGGGWFADTVMYYGYYTNQSIRIPSTNPVYYEMPYAYVLTAGSYLLLSVIISVVSLSRSYRRHHILEGRTANMTIVFRVLNGWDYSLTRTQSAKLAHNALYISFKEYLSKFSTDRSLRCGSRCCQVVLLRFFTNIVILGVIAGAGYIVYFIQTTGPLDNAFQESFVSDMLKPFVITAMVFILPFIFTLLAHLESYSEPGTELHITMFRTMLLDAVILGMMMWYWLTDLTKLNKLDDSPDYKKDTNFTETNFNRTNFNETSCWETSVGMQIYRLVLMDFVFLLLFSFLAEFIRRLMGQYCCKRLGRPEFNIGRNTLSLIYSQTLCWLGSFYSPLLSLIQILKLVIFFYVKRASVVMNCAPPTKAWRGSRVQTSFRFVLVVMCIFSTAAVAYGIITITPSTTCGPYRGQNSTLDIIAVLRSDLENRFEWLSDLVDFFKSPGFVTGVIIFLIVILHYSRILAIAKNEQVQLLRSQVHLEGLDKTFLLQQLRQVKSDKVVDGVPLGASAVSPPISAVQRGIIDTDSIAGGAPGNPKSKVFSKAALKAAEEWMGSQSSLNSEKLPKRSSGKPPSSKLVNEHLRSSEAINSPSRSHEHARPARVTSPYPAENSSFSRGNHH